MGKVISQEELNKWFGLIQPVVEGLDLTESQYEQFFRDVVQQVKEQNEFWKEATK